MAWKYRYSQTYVSRFVKPWLENMEDVKRWAYVHMPPGRREVEAFQKRMVKARALVENGVDIVRRNGFYETTDFWSPRQLQTFLGERLREEAELAHSAGRVCSYTVCTGVMPILDYLAELPFDAYDGIEPALGNQDMRIVA